MPVIEAPPVRLRGFTHGDLPVVLDASTDALIPLQTTVPTTSDPQAARAFIDRQAARLSDGTGCSFAIADAATDVAVGQVGLWVDGVRDGRASIGYWVSPSHRRCGWATQALRAISRWGFTLSGLERLELYVEPGNEASWRCAERAGYRREGLLRSWQPVGGRRRDMYMYARLRDDQIPPYPSAS
jgi:RimJ/RimL family protein N-acetyltransferase